LQDLETWRRSHDSLCGTPHAAPQLRVLLAGAALRSRSSGGVTTSYTWNGTAYWWVKWTEVDGLGSGSGTFYDGDVQFDNTFQHQVPSGTFTGYTVDEPASTGDSDTDPAATDTPQARHDHPAPGPRAPSAQNSRPGRTRRWGRTGSTRRASGRTGSGGQRG